MGCRSRLRRPSIATTIWLYDYLGGEGTTSKHITLLMLVYALAGLMISTIRYASFKDLNLRDRQPFGLLVVGIILLQLTIAEPQIMLFAITCVYALSGPVGMVLRLWKNRRSEEAGPDVTLVQPKQVRESPEQQSRSLDNEKKGSV